MQTIDIHALNISATDTILDLGCGEGRHALAAHWLSHAHHILAVDINFDDVKSAKQKSTDLPVTFEQEKHCHMLVADGFQLPFEQSTFDVVICSEVLEHIHEYQSFVTEIHRVLKPGGKLAISVPRAWPEKICWALSKEYHDVEGGHVRIFNGNKLKRHVEQSQFIFDKKHFAHALHVPYWWMRCLFWRRGEQMFLVRLYHRFLVWDLMKSPWISRTLEKALNPIMGKSLVMYFTKK